MEDRERALEPQQSIIRKPHPNTIILMDRLGGMRQGDFLPYEQLSQLIGLDVRDRDSGYRYLYAAIRKLRRGPDGMNFAPVPGKGIKCCSDQEAITELAPKRNKRMKTQLRIKQEELNNVDAANLTPEQVRVLTVELGHARMILSQTTKAYMEKERRKIELNEPPPPPPLIVE